MVHATKPPPANELPAYFDTKRINHSVEEHCQRRSLHQRGEEPSAGGAARQAARDGIAGPVSGPLRQGDGPGREDHRQHSNGAQVQDVLKLVVSNPPSVDFRGYWQRSQRSRKAA